MPSTPSSKGAPNAKPAPTQSPIDGTKVPKRDTVAPMADQIARRGIRVAPIGGSNKGAK